MQKSSGCVKTYDGTKCAVIGKISSLLTYEAVSFFVIHDSKQGINLGIDFWHLFKLTDRILNPRIDEMDTGCNISTNENLKFHALTHVQKKRLDSVIEMFPNYERDGLGKIRVISHAIDTCIARPVKQRHWPVSPAIGKIIFFRNR